MPFAVRDGRRLHWTLEDKAGQPPLLLLHPDGADLSIWDATAATLSGHYRVLRADLRGHGASEASDAPGQAGRHGARCARGHRRRAAT